MSFFSDPELYIVWGRQMGFKFYMFRVKTKPGCPFIWGEFCDYEVLNFSKHLSLPHNQETDFQSLFSYLSKIDKFVNCQGLVINWFSDDPEPFNTYSWSPEGLNLSTYGIHVLVSSHQENEADVDLSACINERDRERAEKQALEKKVSDLYEQLNREKQAYENQILDLTSKLEQCSGGGAKDGLSVDEEHWMTGNTVPSNWVPFEKLDALNAFPSNNPLTITKAEAPGKHVHFEDDTTNVQGNRFYVGGEFPIVIVNVDELVPDKENARFDPDIWGLFQNAGTSYAARKPYI